MGSERARFGHQSRKKKTSALVLHSFARSISSQMNRALQTRCLGAGPRVSSTRTRCARVVRVVVTRAQGPFGAGDQYVEAKVDSGEPLKMNRVTITSLQSLGRPFPVIPPFFPAFLPLLLLFRSIYWILRAVITSFSAVSWDMGKYLHPTNAPARANTSGLPPLCAVKASDRVGGHVILLRIMDREDRVLPVYVGEDLSLWFIPQGRGAGGEPVARIKTRPGHHMQAILSAGPS